MTTIFLLKKIKQSSISESYLRISQYWIGCSVSYVFHVSDAQSRQISMMHVGEHRVDTEQYFARVKHLVASAFSVLVHSPGRQRCDEEIVNVARVSVVIRRQHNQHWSGGVVTNWTKRSNLIFSLRLAGRIVSVSW